ncbi:hypothetical protein GCM10011316_12250 [Roseibium aquae]|uniref:Uncharacterized protein n=1 Tax=Roseibium aquae TaxID=1323746 RepID=A0A916TEF5_9HYPH|nr:hypothetical protein [Roseibium aquae]GGB41837.1 hypothetical protein GCM10011316_12250 [Roseibium aquae]
MFDVYAHSFLEATRFTANTRPDPKTQTHLLRTARRHPEKSDRWLRGHHLI